MDDEGAVSAGQVLRRHAENEIRAALADTRVGDDFVSGIVLYTGQQTIP